MKVYSPHDVFIARRNSNSSSFEEYVLTSGANKVLYFDSGSNLVALNPLELTVGSCSYFSGSISNAAYATNAGSASHALQSDSSSYILQAISASYAPFVQSYQDNTISSSFASSSISASYALNAGSGMTLVTASFYPITSSWTLDAIVSISSSWASSSLSASYAPFVQSYQVNTVSSSFASSSLSSSYITGSILFNTSVVYPLTSSWAVSASWAPSLSSEGSISSSWASQSLSASYAPFTQTYQVNTVSSSWASSSLSASFATELGRTTYNISVIYASSSKWATSASYASQSLSASYAPFTQVYQVNTVSSSWASASLSSSYSSYIYYNVTQSLTLIDSSSWASSSLSSSYSTLARTASYFNETYQLNTVSSSYASSSTIAGTATNLGLTAYNISVIYASSSRWATSSSFASSSLSASYALNAGGGMTLVTASFYPITSSWAENTISSSYISGSIVIQGTSGYYPKYHEESLTSTSSIYEDVTGVHINVPLLATSSWAVSASWAPSVASVPSVSSSWASQSLSASYAPFTQVYQLNTISSSWATSSLSASYAITLGRTEYNISVTYASSSRWATSASYASSSLSASWAPFQSSSIILSTDGNTFVVTNNNSISMSVNDTQVINVIKNDSPTRYIGSGSTIVNGFLSSSNINNGYPISFDWSGLNGSYFQNWNPNTYVSEMLRFFAGAFSSSFPNPTPNTRTFNSITTNANSIGSTVTINGRMPSGSTDPNLNYLSQSSWVSVGGQVFSGYTFRNSSTYNTTYDSVVGGSTIVSSSIGAQAIGLGPLNNSSLQVFNVSSSIRELFYSSSILLPSFTTSSQALYTINTSNSGSGLSLQSIPSVNTAVIPSAYQDGRFTGITGSGLVWNNTTNLLSSISASGKYDISGSIGISSGSSPYNFISITNASYFYTPVTDGTFATNTLITINSNTSSILALSRSLSGAPYLTTGSRWSYTFTGSGAFNPLYNNGTIAQVVVGTNVPGVTTQNVFSASVDGTGKITTIGTICDSSSLTPKTTGTYPVQTDLIVFKCFYTSSATSTNVIQTGLSNQIIPFTSSMLTRAGVALNHGTQSMFIHVPGTFGQPISSGSLAYWGRPQNYSVSTDVGTSETFVDESQRIELTDSVLQFSGSYFTSSKALGVSDLQVKPGFLVNPGGTYKYWYTGSFGNQYKYYIRHFRRTTTVVSEVIDPGVTLVNWDDTTSPGIAAVLIFQSANSNNYPKCRFYDINKLVGSVLTDVTTGFMNPFSSNVDIYYNGTGGKVGTQITVPIVNANGMFLDGTSVKSEFYLMIRYNNDPVPISNINVS